MSSFTNVERFFLFYSYLGVYALPQLTIGDRRVNVFSSLNEVTVSLEYGYRASNRLAPGGAPPRGG